MARFLILVMFLMALGCAFAGEDVELIGSDGQVLNPAQIDLADSRKTCGDCHEFDDHAKSVHFNRTDASADLDSTDCLSCHLGKFSANGTIIKTPRVSSPESCISCHSDMDYMLDGKTEVAHAKLGCYGCHPGSGHETAASVSCQKCHDGKGNAPKPKHSGFTKLHISRIECQACHNRAHTRSFSRSNEVTFGGMIRAVGEDGAFVYHGVAAAKNALGSSHGKGMFRSGCSDCHSSGANFFFGKSTIEKDGKSVEVPNYQTLGFNRSDVQLGILREGLIKPLSMLLFIAILVMSVLHYAIFGPKRIDLSCEKPTILRFKLIERLIHITAITSFIILAVTGIMFILRLESPGGSLRSIHSHVGPIFLAAIIGMLIVWWKNALFVSCDKDWVCKMGGYLWIKGTCPAEKFNAGQKSFYWLIVVLCGVVVSLTGISLLMPGKAASWVFTLHDIAAVAIVAGIIGHAYLSVFANPGTIYAIITGRVCRSWAEHHHPDWLHGYEHEE